MHALRDQDAGEAPQAAVAAYLVGQDQAGRWLAIEARGRAGGLFASRDAAYGFAQSETGYRPGAVALAAGPLAWW